MAADLYSHFHPDEHAFVDQALEWIERAASSHRRKLTDFLDPRQAWIVETLANREPDVSLRMSGGYPDAERKRAVIAPAYMAAEQDGFGIALLSVVPAGSRFLALHHGDYLGSLLGLGIKREKLGDLLVSEAGCQCLLAAEISEYVRLNLQQVHRTSVVVEMLALDSLNGVREEFAEIRFTVASMRLDAVLGDVYRLSRAKALIPIKAGKCRVNWKNEENPSRLLIEGDVVSLTGLGRFKVLEIAGVSKKGRMNVKVGKYK